MSGTSKSHKLMSGLERPGQCFVNRERSQAGPDKTTKTTHGFRSNVSPQTFLFTLEVLLSVPRFGNSQTRFPTRMTCSNLSDHSEGPQTRRGV